MGDKRAGQLLGTCIGRLTCLEFVGKTETSRAGYICKCECGSTKFVQTSSLTSGSTNSCGCIRKEQLRSRVIKHGQSYSVYYRLWQAIKNRCNNPNTDFYYRYGERGIHVHEEWYKSFEAFYAYLLTNLGPRPSDKHSLDRIDGDKGYLPGNIRWLTGSGQAFNTAKTVKAVSGFRGVTKHLNKFKAVISAKGVKRHLGMFDTAEAASEAYKKASLELYGELPPEYR